MTGDPVSSDSGLARYQERLLEVLYRGGDGEAMITEIEAVAAELNERLGALDPALVEVASTLTQSWGRLDPE